MVVPYSKDQRLRLKHLSFHNSVLQESEAIAGLHLDWYVKA